MGWGSCCCLGTSGPGDLCFTVMQCCSRPHAGADIVVKNGGGTTVCSGTTDSNGRFCCTALAFGTYTYTVNPNDADYDSVGSTSVVHDSNPENVSVYLVLADDTLRCGPCDDPAPSAIVLNDGFGDISCAPETAGSGYYLGCATRTLYPISVGPFANQFYAAIDPTVSPCEPLEAADVGYGISVAVGFLLNVTCTDITLHILLPIARCLPSGSAQIDYSADCTDFTGITNTGIGTFGKDYTTYSATAAYGGWLCVTCGYTMTTLSGPDCAPLAGEIAGGPFGSQSYPGTPANQIGWLRWIYGNDPVIFTYSE